MKGMDMTQGKILPMMVKFALPLMLGDLFQQLYVTTDSVIIGQFAGIDALAAVGATFFLIRLIIGLFTGISAGASVVISQSTGAKDYEKLSRSIHTMAGLTIYGGIVLTAVGIVFAKPLLKLVATPPDIMEQAVIYLRLYFTGAFAELIYNVGGGVLRAFGDSKRPFIFLVISSVVNILLDLLFIGVFHMGTAGAAFATALSQVVSASLVVYNMLHTSEHYKLHLRKIHIEKRLVPEILQMGLPAGLQNMIVALSNVIVQANINSAGTAVVAGIGVFNKIDGLIMLPINALAVTAMTFTGQNYGAGKKRRIISGIKWLWVLEALTWMVGTGICILFGDRLFYLFTDDAKVIYYARMNIKYCIPCYWALATGCAMNSVIRGMGKSKEASILFIMNMCVMRQVWILFAKWRQMGVDGIILSYPVSWVLTVGTMLLYALYLKQKGEFNENADQGEYILRVS